MTKIYTLSDPVTNEIRYVGKTVGSLKIRLNSHIRESLKNLTYKSCWIRGLFKSGKKPIIELIEDVQDEEWRDCEKFYISYFKFLGFNLTNISSGGEIKSPIEDIRKKLSSVGKGRTHSEESKLKIGLANSGKNNGMYGVIISDEDRKKRREFHLGKKMNIESIEKTRKANIGRKNSNEVKIRMRNSSTSKKILYQLDLSGKLIKCWESLAECCRQTMFSKKCISRCCNGGRLKSYRKFKWTYQLH